jgi:hypothetical protein
MKENRRAAEVDGNKKAVDMAQTLINIANTVQKIEGEQFPKSELLKILEKKESD